MDVLLGGGLVAAVLFVGAFLWGIYRYLDHATKETAAQWTPSIMFFVLATATQESFFTGNHFLWLLFVAAIVGKLSEFNSLQSES